MELAPRAGREAKTGRTSTELLATLIVSLLFITFQAQPVAATEFSISGTYTVPEKLGPVVNPSVDPCLLMAVKPLCGGGGTGTPNMVKGIVAKYGISPTQGVAGILVFIMYDAATFDSTRTDAYGNFQFSSAYYIHPDTSYMVTVNGRIDLTCADLCLGKGLGDTHYGQWAGVVRTDHKGYGDVVIKIEAAPTVSVPSAALFSNTQYATKLWYGRVTGSETAFGHSLSFGSSSFFIGYMTGTTSSSTFSVFSLQQIYVQRYHYAGTYWCDGGTATAGWTCGSPGIKNVGIAGPTENSVWGTLPTTEYVNPNTLPSGSYGSFDLAGRSEKTQEFTETGSFTWSVSISVPFAIRFRAYQTDISIDTTVSHTQGTTYTLAYDVTNTSSQTLRFWVYTAGTVYDENSGIGGMELHIWDMTPGGG